MDENNFKMALAELLEIEGAYSDVGADRGGKTTWGITEALARREPWCYEGPMNELPLELAERIYLLEYWNHRRLSLDAMTEAGGASVAREVFEQAVNTGQYLTAKRCQRVLNVLNRDEALFYDLKVDGWLGRATRDAISVLYREPLGETDILIWLNIAQGRHYFDLLESDPSQEAFARGWARKRVKL